MRVTNLMMSGNALFNLQKQEQRLNRLDQQYSTQKKISSPSEDPIIATRALKLNTTYSEVSQYLEKNIPDSEAWMSMTQSALDNTGSILSTIYEKCVQGNTDGLSDTDRDAIATSLAEYRDQIYQEGTSSYSGRFLFTGFKTDTNLIFAEDSTDEYTITETMTPASLSVKSTIVNSLSETDTAAGVVPNRVDFNRLRLAYDITDPTTIPTIEVTNTAGGTTNLTVTKSFATYDDFIADYETNSLDPGAVVYIADKGELILGDAATDVVKACESLDVTYQKNGFKGTDLRPEHYFTCTRVANPGTDIEQTFEYKQNNQEIKYLVNYNQQMIVNVQAQDSFTHNMGRDVDDLVNIVKDAIAAEDKMNMFEEKMKAAPEGSADRDAYSKLYQNAKVEYELKTKVMQEAFASNETGFQGYANKFSNCSTDVGSRQQRVALIKTRLENQQADVEELASENIDVDLSEIIVRYTSALDVYQAALSATSKSITNTLLDYL